jgi:hypothetical protein
VEGCERDDGIEAVRVRLPRLEVGADNRDIRELAELAPRGGGELLSELDADDLETAFGQRPRRLPGPGPELENAAARRDSG